MGNEKYRSKDSTTRIGRKLILSPLNVNNYHKLQSLNKTKRDPEDIPENSKRCEREFFSQRQVLRSIDASLGLHRERMRKGVAQADRQWAVLEEKEKRFKVTFMQFQHFFKSNMYKRERFIEAYLRHVATLKKRNEEIRILKLNLQKMKEVRIHMREKIWKFEDKYLNFLNSTVKESCKYNEIKEMMDAFDALMTARDITSKKESDALDLFEERMDIFRRMIMEKMLQVRNTLLVLDRLWPVYAESKTRALKAELSMRNVIDEIHNFNLETETTLAAIYTMYVQICRRKCVVPMFRKGNYTNHLPFIKWNFGSFKKIEHNSIQRTSMKEGIKP